MINVIPLSQTGPLEIGRLNPGMRRREWFIVWAAAILLLAEVIGLTLRFDAKLITRSHLVPNASGSGMAAPSAAPWTVWLLSNASLALKASIVAALATVIFGGRTLREDLKKITDTALFRWSWGLFVGHLLAFVLFFKICERLLESGEATGTWAPAWLAAWLGSGVTVIALLIGSVVAPEAQKALFRCLAKAIAVGMVVGSVAAIAGLSATLLWKPLGIWTLRLTHTSLQLLGISTVYKPSEFIIGTESFQISIAPECSGYEGIGLVLAFLGAYLWFFRDRFRLERAWILLPVGVLAIWLANTARIVGLILVGTWLSPRVAINGFHSQAGWIAFNAVTLGLVAILSKSTYFLRDEVSKIAVDKAVSREAVYLTPLLAIVFTAMVTGAFRAGGLDYLYPLRLVAVAIPFWYYRREYAALRWTFSWQSIAIGVLVFAIWIVRMPVGNSSTQADEAAGMGGVLMALWMAARVIGSSLSVPIAEELAFRGFLTRRLISADFDALRPGAFTWISFLVSSIVFGLLHDRWIEGTIAGLLYAIAYYRRGSIGDAAVAHATTNGMLSVEALITGDWSLWS